MLGEREVIWAMYGDPVVRMDIDRSTDAAVATRSMASAATAGSPPTTSTSAL